MTKPELNQFLDENRHIEWAEDEGALLFRNANLPWYQEDPKHATRITAAAMQGLDEMGLLKEINRGVDVTGIARITGYFSKISSWNGGKLAELRDRNQTGFTKNV